MGAVGQAGVVVVGAAVVVVVVMLAVAVVVVAVVVVAVVVGERIPHTEDPLGAPNEVLATTGLGNLHSRSFFFARGQGLP